MSAWLRDWLARNVRACFAAAAIVIAVSFPIGLVYLVLEERAERESFAERRAEWAEDEVARLRDHAAELAEEAAAERRAEHAEILGRLEELESTD